MDSKEILNKMLDVVDAWLFSLEVSMYEEKCANERDNQMHTSLTLLKCSIMLLIAKEESNEKTISMPHFSIN